ncbi:hypothetical protein ACWT_7012 [Actinoplanes sp. SE50]|uniref:hypothetical protein n=1 Tax=unclassified Actinoplanes TaxID=2626549 RepID=UPI00023EC395|nr:MULTISPECIES: hypothetical protein [unclassified Actinoplanes]AEV88023.1 hypothetical protein ACPL_7143 [Actinoplanes sp. SE50/110]ATO86427.1 hypothetical protein ACWT_7012 [Actinoplanes sp. SE50]SLM03842.1 hypothetical protein ACSP50_7141 [Actinoplanes sp. SE50/110]
MRTVLAALGVVTLLAAAGCKKQDTDAPVSLPPVTIVEQPAASAGGACILWDWAFIQQKIGVRFSVAAADQVDDTSTCVVQTVDGSWPDLSLSVVEETKADAKVFLANRVPKKGVKLKGLGKAGYRLTGPAADGHGPTVEIGWLSEAEQLQTLRFTFEKGAASSSVTAMNDRLLELAKAMDTTDG